MGVIFPTAGWPKPTITRNPYLTNVRNTDSKYWRTWPTKPEQQCLVPVPSFAEPDNTRWEVHRDLARPG